MHASREKAFTDFSLQTRETTPFKLQRCNTNWDAARKKNVFGFKSFAKPGSKLCRSEKNDSRLLTAVHLGLKNKLTWEGCVELFTFGRNAASKTNVLAANEASLKLGETRVICKWAVASSLSARSRKSHHCSAYKSHHRPTRNGTILKLTVVHFGNRFIGHQTISLLVNGVNLVTVPMATFVPCWSTGLIYLQYQLPRSCSLR